MASETKTTFLFASEAVARGHPDKCCDQVSDAIVDACRGVDPDARVAVETTVKGNTLGLYGEVTMTGEVNYEQVARRTVAQIGYSAEAIDMDPRTMTVTVAIRGQEEEIGAIVDRQRTASKDEIGAGDQGLMFGYATNETPECMPMSHALAQGIQMALRAMYDCAQEQIRALVMKTGKKRHVLEAEGALDHIAFWWLRADAKSQVIVEYEKLPNGALKPLHAKRAVLSVQHSDRVAHCDYEQQLQVVVKSVLDKYAMHSDEHTEYLINIKQKTSGANWTVGGPNADAGTTGRKIIVDTYGGHGAHGGGAFSGKDATKVDRSAAYYLRYAAKSLVASGLCERALIQVSYVIGQAEPLNIHVDSYGTGDDAQLLRVVRENFDFRPGHMIEELHLFDTARVQYADTAYHGHFGRACFPWEQPKKLSVAPPTAGMPHRQPLE
eukprot:TRINITY_DN2660_c0_g1_i7.p1 TRINITY_DN2660_c0_g1~~TRINITY_DN2660_c0_g1_i7.p1  ORF type:complete len:438 (-),score=165.31 TRINITY_DN2660_c0_g1_i7:225-1538(-)